MELNNKKNIVLIICGILYLSLFVSCRVVQGTNENFKFISKDHYFFVGTSPNKIGEQIYKNFMWSNVTVSDREFEGIVYVRFFVNYKNEFSNIAILTKTNSQSIDKELIRCVKLLKIPCNRKMNRKAIIEVIAEVSF